MREHGLLTTLVVLMCTRHLIADATLKITTSEHLKFWEKGNKMYTQTSSEKSRRHDPMGSLLELFFHSPGNQSVFRYSEIQQMLKKMGKGDTRRLMDDLPEILETADLLLSAQNVTIPKKTTPSEKKLTIKLRVKNGILTKKKTSKSTRDATAWMRTVFHYKQATKAREYYDPRKNARRKASKYVLRGKLRGFTLKRKHHNKAKRKTFSPVRYTKASRKTFRPVRYSRGYSTFDALKFWVRDPIFEEKWTNALNPGIKARSIISKNYLNNLERNYLRDPNVIKGSYNSLRAVNYPLRLSSRAPWQVHSSENNPGFRCRPSAESFEQCYHHYRAHHRRIPQLMRAIAQSTAVRDTNVTTPVVRARNDVEDTNNTVPELRVNNVVEATRSGAKEQEKKKKEKKLHEDLNPYGILQQVKEKLKPAHKMDANITVEVLGRTLEYKDIVLIKATALPKKVFRAEEDKYDKGVAEKKIVLIVHGLAVMGLKYVPCLSTVEGFSKLMSYYYEHLEQFDIFVIPMANPDGVAQWHTFNGIWNKNASPQSACPGVALDRNFDVAWNDSQHAVSSCRQQYPGPEPFSEPESRAVRDVLHKYSNRIIAYFHVHASSYSPEVFKGDAVLYPKGYTDIASDDDKYVDLKAEIDDVMRNASFKVYSFTTDTLFNWYGKVSGTSVDYVASVYGIPFSMELVMQLYEDDMMVEESEERETAIVFTEVWHKVIDVIFNFMYKSQSNPDEK